MRYLRNSVLLTLIMLSSQSGMPQDAKPSPVPSASPTTAAGMSMASGDLSSAREALINIANQISDSDLLSEEVFRKVKDPFQKPAAKNASAEEPKSELERFPVDQYELLGIVSGPLQMRAMVRSPDNQTLMVGERMRMGVRGGSVIRIGRDSILIREKQFNIVGKEEPVEIELRISPKAGGQQKSSGG
jgi:hypothetical protein